MTGLGDLLDRIADRILRDPIWATKKLHAIIVPVVCTGQNKNIATTVPKVHTTQKKCKIKKLF